MRNFEPVVLSAAATRYRRHLAPQFEHARPHPHPDALDSERWLHVVTCIAQHHAFIEQQGASAERLARSREALDYAFRAPHGAEAREAALVRLRVLSAEGGLAQSALELAEASE
jgi:hypothetical protein